jgi:hypothetical protein
MKINLQDQYFCYQESTIYWYKQKLGLQTNQKSVINSKKFQCLYGCYLRHINCMADHIRREDSFFA